MGHTIYLADDEKSIRELLHSFLASDGYAVRSFESGDALLEAFRQEPAELVILDIMMPGTDGLAVCRALRSVSDIPINLLTAKDSELDYVMGISQGSDDYLTKPFRPTILLMKVKALLRRVEMDRGKTAAAEDELHYGDIRYSCLLYTSAIMVDRLHAVSVDPYTKVGSAWDGTFGETDHLKSSLEMCIRDRS